MQRRNILGGILSAPLLLGKKPPTHSPSVPPSSLLSPESLDHQGAWGTPERLLSDVENAKKRIEGIRAYNQQPKVRDSYDRSLEFIECRKATSPAIKRILADEYRAKFREEEAEDDLVRAMWRLGAPDWMRDFF